MKNTKHKNIELLKLASVQKLIKLGKKNNGLSYKDISDILPCNIKVDGLEDILILLNKFNININDKSRKTVREKENSKESAKENIAGDHTKYYLRDISKIELLSEEGERAIANNIIHGKLKLQSVVFASKLTLELVLSLVSKNKPNVFKIFDYDISAYPNKNEKAKLENKLNRLKLILEENLELINNTENTALLKKETLDNKVKLIKVSLDKVKEAELSFSEILNIASVLEEKMASYISKKDKIQKDDSNFSLYNLEFKQIENELGGDEKLIENWYDELKSAQNIISHAKNNLIKANLRLVINIAKRFLQKGVYLFDLIQEGNIGLIKATERFKYKANYRFSTYASWWIRQAITESIAKQKRIIRVPLHINEKIKIFTKAKVQLLQSLDREPSISELSSYLDWDIEKVKHISSIAIEPISLESEIPSNDDNKASLINMIEDKNNPSIEYAAASHFLREQLDKIIKTTLPKREQTILKLRFGLTDGHVYSLSEAGNIFSLTRERIRQLEARALQKLRSINESKYLKDYMI